MKKLLASIQEKDYSTRRNILIACTGVASILVVWALILTVSSLRGDKTETATTQDSNEPGAWESFKEKSGAAWGELKNGVGGITEEFAKNISTSTDNSAIADTKTQLIDQLKKATQDKQ